ncbi:MAG: LEA type 2 family protein [Cyclobacteriaceae bacterium]|nr:LEA type 2 family protein [Cyclobacteriaceae bacterium]
MRVYFPGKWFVFIIISFSAFSCTDFEEIAFKEVENIRIGGIKDGELMVAAEARFFNPNKKKFKLKNADIKVLYEGNELAQLEPSEKVVIPASSEFTIPVAMRVKLSDLGGDAGILGLFTKRSFPLRFKGHFNISYGILPLRINVDFTEEIKM